MCLSVLFRSLKCSQFEVDPKDPRVQAELLQLGNELASKSITFEEWDRKVKAVLAEQQQEVQEKRTNFSPLLVQLVTRL